MQNVVTVYCCGTNKHRDMEDYLIGNLFRLDLGAPQSDTECGHKYIVDGPGSSRPISKTKSVIDNLDRGKRSGFSFGDSGKAKAYGPLTDRLQGIVSGKGWADNVYEVQQWLLLVDAKLKTTTGRNLERVNLIGHSRGAVTCNMIAHMMSKTNPAWEANIVGLDPVPGSDASSFRAEEGTIGNLYELPPNVRNYFAMLMEHVGTDGVNIRFQPIFLEKMKFERAGNLNFTQLPLPGKHGDLSKFELESVPLWKISASNCVEFLTRLGTRFTQPDLQLDTAGILEQYAMVHLNRMDHLEPKDAFTLGKKDFRWFISEEWGNNRGVQVNNPVRDHPYYINLQHANAFEQCCPNVVRSIDMKRPVTSQVIIAEQYFRNYPQSIQLMWKLGFITDAQLAQKVWSALCQYKAESKGVFTRQSQDSKDAVSGLRALLSSTVQIPTDNILAPTVRWLCGGAPLAPSLASQAHLSQLKVLKSGGRLQGLLTKAFTEWDVSHPRFY